MNLVRGQGYDLVAPSMQVGFLDYTLFEDHPSFYTTYRLMDTREHYPYTDKLSIGVVDLTRIDLATDEDRAYNIDKWAQLFKAETWEDIKMIAKQDVFINKAGETYFEITADEHERQLAEGREDVLRRERARKRREDKLMRELAQSRQDLSEKEQMLSEKDKIIATLEARLAQFEENGAAIED